MLNNLDLSVSLDKEIYKVQIEDLMKQLSKLQQSCWEQKLPIVVVLEGWAAAGKGSLVKKIINYIDPRGFLVYPILQPSAHEESYPFLWRFWQKIPPAGLMSIFYHSWYIRVLEDRLLKKLPNGEVPLVMADINAFERQLRDQGVVIAKFWIHLSQKELKKRIKEYAEDELESWRVRPEDWQQAKKYDEYSQLAQEMITSTSTGVAPWILVEGDCQRWARVKVLSQLVATMVQVLDRARVTQVSLARLPNQERLLPGEPDFLAKVDLNLKLDNEEYKTRLREAQVELRKLQRRIYDSNLPVLVIFEGWDAAGKGGAIKRLTDTLDPRSYQVHAFAAPTEEEKKYHYLWRFWRELPAKGTIGIFDRTWYGRVLVERIEGFANEIEWRQAYQEINEFEDQLVHAGYILVKFWLHISKEEQLKRFQEREQNPYKQYKLTAEDWRNREQWDVYDVAVNQMVARTSTASAPWTLVPGNDKYYARVKVLETVISAVKSRLKENS
ncbi:MAG: Polyphosphate:AMP phosphotransferase [Chroococcopsis gigantea SAG 12.99]|jgi:polyphosphate:AMP phosphotransferase|nr:polyphosphate:AMP phosphotransferase [Chlorogloea purpurea SAG 13.99]MDV3000498.1 Polyphosphate:AMP phosphotransferase [Chroococcopsis gigantea SAG 12.99]